MSKKEETITITKSTMWMTATFVFAILWLSALATGGWGIGGTGQVVAVDDNNEVAPTAPSPSPSPSPSVSVEVTDNDPVLGDDDAKISVVEFSDFQCPFCGRAATQTLGGLKDSELFTSGDVNIVYKHFPLESIHPQARPSAIASFCAQEQGKFWEFHDLLFANQQSLSESNYLTWAGDIGLDVGDFESCLDSSEADAKVTADLKEATAAGGRGTPYFVVLNHDTGDTAAVSGAVPYANLEAAIKSVQ